MSAVLEDVNLISKTVRECLNAYHLDGGGGSVVANPAGFTAAKIDATTACMLVMTFRRLRPLHGWRTPTGFEEVQDVLSRLCSTHNPFTYLAVRSSRSLDLLDQLVADLDFSKAAGALPEIYERVIEVEYALRDGRVAIVGGGTDRNRLGGYYTPPRLADATVRQAVDRLIQQRIGIKHFSQRAETYRELGSVLSLLANLEVVDRACGAGRFLVALLRYVRRYVPRGTQSSLFDGREPILGQLARNITGTDIDATALELARAEISVTVGDPEVYAETASNFKQGNPILRPKKSNWSMARDAFRHGFIYHKVLGLQTPAKGSYDLEIGNPPWERIRFEERNFFRYFASEVASISRKDERARAIDRLAKARPNLHSYYLERRDRLEEAKGDINSNPVFETASYGEPNTYALFAALALSEVREDGVVALLVKSSLFTTAAHRHFFHEILEKERLVAVYDFINREQIFPIDGRERFSLMIGGRGGGKLMFSAGLKRVEELNEEPLELTPRLLEKLNPVTGMLPSVTSRTELDLLVQAAEENNDFDDVYPDAHFGRLVHLTSHDSELSKDDGSNRLAVYEGKFIDQYDGRYATFEGVSAAERYTGKAYARRISDEDKTAGTKPEARFFINLDAWNKISKNYQEPWSLMWRNTTSASNSRTCIATILPHMPATQSVQLLQLSNRDENVLALLLGIMNSIPFDYMLRRKLNGIDLTQSVVRQVPVPSCKSWKEIHLFNGKDMSLRDHAIQRVRALLSKDNRLHDFCSALNAFEGEVIDNRKTLRWELDVLVANAYGFSPSQLIVMAQDFDAGKPVNDAAINSAAHMWPQRAQTTS